MSYENIAKSILKDSIKSAIYIDEEAREFYQEKTDNPKHAEELSMQLYDNFRNEGISLDVCKFELGDQSNDHKLSYFTDNRDLLILDWKLEGQGGEDKALQILSKVVEAKNLHFCAIYTSEKDLDNVFKNVMSFFSGLNKAEHLIIKEQLEIKQIDEGIIDILNQICFNRFDKEIRTQHLKKLSNKDRSIIGEIKEITGVEEVFKAISLVSISQWNKVTSDIKQPEPSSFDLNKKILVIENTIIVILSKGVVSANQLIDTFYDHIIKYTDSFNYLLGLELRNNINKTSPLVNQEIVSFSKEALLYHRKQLENNSDFVSFMKEVLKEKISLSLDQQHYVLLSDDCMNELEKNALENDLSQEEIIKLNYFYNAIQMDKKNKLLSFGDVFQNQDGSDFYMCITPLCDCLRPEKVDGDFYFVKGSIFTNKKEALKLGDAGFMSYLPDNKIVLWGNVRTNQAKAKYIPLYIKPCHYKINENTINEDHEINVHFVDEKGNAKSLTLSYVATIRQNYAQRIANHTFMYPMRVGIDFVRYDNGE